MENKLSNTNIKTCDECGSDYFSDTSQMTNLCPECSHILYGYESCGHQFEDGRCIKCFWNGNLSYIVKNIKYKKLNKNDRLLHILEFLQDKYGETNIVIKDHWEDDKVAIGVTDKTGLYLAYVSTVSDKENNYFLSLENPPIDNELPYSPAGDFDNISLLELENILTRHLRLV